ncbi:Glycosyltransferase [Psidium guajava]|nr:Glycosyltransferase [Psidium guajava]
MASIRRTLSPVPRPGTPLNGEACSVSSPLSKSSSCALTPSQTPSGGIMSILVGLLDSLAFAPGVFSQRPSRLYDRPKPRGQTWRRALFHFFVCFIIGMFIGVTQFASTNASMNFILKNHALSFEQSTSFSNNQLHDDAARNVTPFYSMSHENDSTMQLQSHQQLSDLIAQNSSNNESATRYAHGEVQKLLIVVTPTQRHPLQAYYLNRLSQTLKLTPLPLLWIVVEMTSQSPETADILRKTGIMYRHLVCDKNLTEVTDVRIHQRNVALSHIETHHLDGLVFFADEDNIYATDLFDQMRQIRRFGTWLVAKVTDSRSGAVLEGPICNGTTVLGWHTSESRRGFKRFYAELSGFAFNSTILWDPKKWHRPTIEPIRRFDTPKDKFPVSTLIEQIVEDESQMEGLLHSCSRVMVWHLRVDPSSYFYPQSWFTKSYLNATASLT